MNLTKEELAEKLKRGDPCYLLIDNLKVRVYVLSCSVEDSSAEDIEDQGYTFPAKRDVLITDATFAVGEIEKINKKRKWPRQATGRVNRSTSVPLQAPPVIDIGKYIEKQVIQRRHELQAHKDAKLIKDFSIESHGDQINVSVTPTHGAKDIEESIKIVLKKHGQPTHIDVSHLTPEEQQAVKDKLDEFDKDKKDK